MLLPSSTWVAGGPNCVRILYLLSADSRKGKACLKETKKNENEDG